MAKTLNFPPFSCLLNQHFLSAVALKAESPSKLSACSADGPSLAKLGTVNPMVGYRPTNQNFFFDFQNFYGSRLYLTSGQLIINAFLILLVTYFVKLNALNFGKIAF